MAEKLEKLSAHRTHVVDRKTNTSGMEEITYLEGVSSTEVIQALNAAIDRINQMDDRLQQLWNLKLDELAKREAELDKRWQKLEAKYENHFHEYEHQEPRPEYTTAPLQDAPSALSKEDQ